MFYLTPIALGRYSAKVDRGHYRGHKGAHGVGRYKRPYNGHADAQDKDRDHEALGPA